MSKRHSSRFLFVHLRYIALFVLLCPAAIAGSFQLAALADAGDDSERGYGLGDANDTKNQNLGGQNLSGANGDTFMEEVVSDKPKPKAAPVPIDLSRVGVSVDPHGNIVPLKDGANDPWAASGVKPFYNHIETSTTVPYVYPNPYAGVPSGGYPGFGRPAFGYGGIGYPGYGNPFSPYNPYNPYNSFNAYNPYNPYNSGYSPFSVGYLTSGNSSTFISNDPTTGAPLPRQGNSQTVYSNTNGSFSPGLTTGFVPGLGAGTWLGPSTSFSQNSMWKAFNLGF